MLLLAPTLLVDYGLNSLSANMLMAKRSYHMSS